MVRSHASSDLTSVGAGASFASYVSTMCKTGVLVARHGPMLANALFLPPGNL